MREIMAEADSAFKIDPRKAVRQQVGDLILTGLLPSAISTPEASGVSVSQSPIGSAPQTEADA